MAVDKTPSQVATSALQAIPFGSIIGGPLKACVEAQALAAKTTWEFIQNVGINVNPETGEKTAVNVSFSFIQGGRLVQLNIPLLTIVPIPYIAIREVDINFKANISASSSSAAETNESVSKDAALKASASLGLGCFKMNANMNASYSSKKDSKATSDSKYSVEYTMDVAVKAGQDSMPAGLSKILELLGNSLDVSDPTGTLEVNSNLLLIEDGKEKVQLIATYKDPNGLLAPEKLTISGTGANAADFKVSGDSKIIDLPEGKYTVKAEGSKKEVIVEVKKDTATPQEEVTE